MRLTIKRGGGGDLNFIAKWVGRKKKFNIIGLLKNKYGYG